MKIHRRTSRPSVSTPVSHPEGPSFSSRPFGWLPWLRFFVFFSYNSTIHNLGHCKRGEINNSLRIGRRILFRISFTGRQVCPSVHFLTSLLESVIWITLVKFGIIFRTSFFLPTILQSHYLNPINFWSQFSWSTYFCKSCKRLLSRSFFIRVFVYSFW